MKIVLQKLTVAVLMITATVSFSQTTRTVSDFNENWVFKKDITPWVWRYKLETFNWEKVTLPHDWSITGPFNKDEPVKGFGAYLPTGTGVYRKNFKLDPSQKDKNITIEFDGVYMNSEVYCNGVWLGKRPNGYIGFSYDITPYVKFGDFENKIMVLVDNSRQISTRWYSGSGINRDVRLVVTDKLFIPQWGTFVTTPKINNSLATVNVKTTVRNNYTDARKITVKALVYNQEGELVAQKYSSAKANEKSGTDVETEIQVARPVLWSVDNPYLYKVVNEVLYDDKVTDRYETAFGIREIRFDADKGFFLNNINVKMKGVCLHHDGGGVGSAVPIQVWERRLKLLKEMGCNAVRTSHNPFDPEFYDLCDKMGFLVMDEFFDEWTLWKLPEVTQGYNIDWEKWWKKDLTDGIKRDRNHPSVVIYCAGNEIIEQNRPWGKELAKEIVDMYHQTDPTRPVTSGNNMVPEANILGFPDVFDVAGYNYGIQFEVYEEDRKNYPQRKFIGTESTRGQSTRGEYVFPFKYNNQPVKTPEGYFSSYDYKYRKFGQENEWKVTKANDYIAGIFLWTGIDHLGESTWPKINDEVGAIDRCGFPKDAFYFYQSQWTEKPMVHLLPHWNWKGKENSEIPIWSYTNCDEVELFLNGKSLGKKDFKGTENLHLDWNVKYQPGELKAIGFKAGKKVAEEIINTTAEPVRFKIITDKKSVKANGRDVLHLVVSALDKNNRAVPVANDKFTITVKGPAKLLSLDNGDPLFKGSFQSSSNKLFNGLALGIIQSTKTKGSIIITVDNGLIKSSESIIIESL